MSKPLIALELINTTIDFPSAITVKGNPPLVIVNDTVIPAIGQLSTSQVESLKGTINSITYNNGTITSIVGAGWTDTITYDSTGRIATYTSGAITKTVLYNVDGTVASYK